MMIVNFYCEALNYSVELGQYNGCWCTGFLCCQVISSHDCDYVKREYSCLLWEWISPIGRVSLPRNNMKCKYTLMLPRKRFKKKKNFKCLFITRYTHSCYDGKSQWWQAFSFHAAFCCESLVPAAVRSQLSLFCCDIYTLTKVLFQ